MMLHVIALTDPELLKQLSRCLTEIRHLFARFDKSGDGYIHQAEFFEVTFIFTS